MPDDFEIGDKIVAIENISDFVLKGKVGTIVTEKNHCSTRLLGILFDEDVLDLSGDIVGHNLEGFLLFRGRGVWAKSSEIEHLVSLSQVLPSRIESEVKMEKTVIKDTTAKTVKKLEKEIEGVKYGVKLYKTLDKELGDLNVTIKVNKELRDFLKGFTVGGTLKVVNFDDVLLHRYRLASTLASSVNHTLYMFLFAKELIDTGKITFGINDLRTFDVMVSKFKNLNQLFETMFKLKDEQVSITYTAEHIKV